VREDNTRFVLLLLMCEISEDAERLNFIVKLVIYTKVYRKYESHLLFSCFLHSNVSCFLALFTVNNKNLDQYPISSLPPLTSSKALCLRRT